MLNLTRITQSTTGTILSTGGDIHKNVMKMSILDVQYTIVYCIYGLKRPMFGIIITF